MLLPILFSVAKKNHNPKKRKTKPKYMSQSEWIWSDYTTSLPNKKGFKGSDSSGGFLGGGEVVTNSKIEETHLRMSTAIKSDTPAKFLSQYCFK